MLLVPSGPSYSTGFARPSSDSSRCGSFASRSESRGRSARARPTSSKSIRASTSASSHSGPRAVTSPRGVAITEPPAKAFPPSNPTSCDTTTHTPCSSAAYRAIRSQRETFPGRDSVSSSRPVPRAGDAEGTRMSCAPCSAAIVGVRECQASSQISIAIRPNRVSNARTPRPDSVNRSSSKTPYVGRNTLRCTWTTPAAAPPRVA